MAQVIQKIPLSGSTDFRGIKVVATATAGTTIHAAQASSTDGDHDEIVLYAYNSHTSAVTLTLEWGGVTSPDDNMKFSLNPGETHLVLPGLPLRNSLSLAAFASVANVVAIHGYVNTVTGN